MLIAASYRILGLISYLTAGETETRAWTIVKGTKAPQAAEKSIAILNAASSVPKLSTIRIYWTVVLIQPAKEKDLSVWKEKNMS